MNLHYSQTFIDKQFINRKSYTSMNLHYSQTVYSLIRFLSQSYTSMNLHYSQTPVGCSQRHSSLIPLWIYITLKLNTVTSSVLSVLYLYEFTLLSNILSLKSEPACCLIPLWIYITLKPLLWRGCQDICLIPLWIYITLKRI